MNREYSEIHRVGFWAAVLTAGLAALSFSIAIFATPLNRYPYPYVPAFISIDYAWLIPAFILMPAFVVVTASVHAYAPKEKKIYSRIGLSFAIVSAVLLMADFFVQWAVILPSTLSGETAGLSLFTQYNPHGLFVAIEALGYLMMSTAFLFLAPVFATGRLQQSLRWLFVASFVLAVGALIVLSLAGFEIVLFEVVAITIDWTVLIVAGVLLGLLFGRSSGQDRGTA